MNNVTYVQSLEAKNYPIYLMEFDPAYRIEYTNSSLFEPTNTTIKIAEEFGEAIKQELDKNHNTVPHHWVEHYSLIGWI